MSEPTRLVVIWSSADREVALHSMFMYTHNSKKKGWWDEVRLIVWGPSARLLVDDTELQEKMSEMQTDGVELLACRACSDRLGVSEQLEALGIEVLYVGVPLTEMLQGGWVCLTY
jgi:hypothetical protein